MSDGADEKTGEGENGDAGTTVFRVEFEGGDPEVLARELGTAADHALHAIDGVKSYNVRKVREDEPEGT